MFSVFRCQCYSRDGHRNKSRFADAPHCTKTAKACVCKLIVFSWSYGNRKQFYSFAHENIAALIIHWFLLFEIASTSLHCEFMRAKTKFHISHVLLSFVFNSFPRNSRYSFQITSARKVTRANVKYFRKTRLSTWASAWWGQNGPLHPSGNWV